MKVLAIAVLSMFVIGCGGGGGGGGSDDGGNVVADESGSAANEALALQILEDCGVSKLEDFLGIIETYEGLLDPESPEPDFQVTGIDLLKASVAWEMDIDKDGTPDANGTVRFTDAGGKATIPFDLNVLLGGVEDLDELTQSMPDGTHVLLAVKSLLDPEFDGDFDFEFLAGAVAEVSGKGTVKRNDCLASFTFENVGIDDLSGEYPIASVTTSVEATPGDLAGDVVLDGTQTAEYRMRVNGGEEVFTYMVDLETGQVTTAE